MEGPLSTTPGSEELEVNLKDEFYHNAPFIKGLKAFVIDEKTPLDADKTMLYALGKLTDVTLIGKSKDDPNEFYMASSLPTGAMTVSRLKRFISVVEDYMEE